MGCDSMAPAGRKRCVEVITEIMKFVIHTTHRAKKV